MGVYLMVCHKDADHGLHMVLSRDGYEWTALNNDRPIKLIGQNRWMLMYDIFSIKPHNFGFMETPNFKTFRHLGHEGMETDIVNSNMEGD